MLIESSTVLEQHIMNIKPNSRKERLTVGHGLFLYVSKRIQHSVFVSVVFIALSLVPESASVLPASLLSDLTTPGDLYGVIQLILTFGCNCTSFLFFFFFFGCAAAVQKPCPPRSDV